MRKLKAIKLDDREIVVKEVTPRMVMKSFANEDGPFAGLSDLVKEVCDLTRDELLDFYGSDLEKIWNAFVEVNSFFFSIAPKLGLEGIVTEMGRNFVTICGEEAASLLSQGIDSATP